MPDAGGRFVEEVFVVGDEDDSAVELLQGLVEGVDRFEIQVVGGFVEDQDVRLEEHEAAEDQTGRFATGESFGGLEGVFTGEEHLTEEAAELFVGGFHVVLAEPVDAVHAVFDGFGMVLSEVADAGFVTPDDVATVDGEFVFVMAGEHGGVGQKRAQEGGFTGTVSAHDGDLVATADEGLEVFEDLEIVVALGEAFELEGSAT